MAKMNTDRIVLSLAANYSWSLQQFDVNMLYMEALKRRYMWRSHLDLDGIWQLSIQISKNLIWVV